MTVSKAVLGLIQVLYSGSRFVYRTMGKAEQSCHALHEVLVSSLTFRAASFMP